MITATISPETRALRELLAERNDDFNALLNKYRATKPRLFGSVARGDANADSDIDILVDMSPADGNILLRASGLLEETRALFGRNVDIFPETLLKHEVSESARAESVSL
ncbi:MAG: nucleotidyltransferase domain-containing protein [Mobiluncus porci]|uniref:nucleotidyltransferase family protein n=1 Tax=Mobiluncus porci TaxID=2652278 RepID=UPI0023F0AD3A|nr:nucleotidyltransferase domain-containing protein [Mobiluncus porci]MDD7542573.1 nucleotidyltransferase domain-containing protein [Mobiluncus porci]MDY5749161.1 nucleotidyltransferase domain-containing protein [Mobiluncus porci]